MNKGTDTHVNQRAFLALVRAGVLLVPYAEVARLVTPEGIAEPASLSRTPGESGHKKVLEKFLRETCSLEQWRSVALALSVEEWDAMWAASAKGPEVALLCREWLDAKRAEAKEVLSDNITCRLPPLGDEAAVRVLTENRDLRRCVAKAAEHDLTAVLEIKVSYKAE